jgi:hypothetical protein
MLRHYDGQRRRLRAANIRRFLGVQGVAHNVVIARVDWHPGQIDYMSLLVLNVRPSARSAEGSSLGNVLAVSPERVHAVPDVVPATQLSIDAAAELVDDAVETAVLIDRITPEQLRVAGFDEPHLSVHPELTGECVTIDLRSRYEPDIARVTVVCEQQFSFDGSGDPDSMCVLVRAADGVALPAGFVCPAHVPVRDAEQAFGQALPAGGGAAHDDGPELQP